MLTQLSTQIQHDTHKSLPNRRRKEVDLQTAATAQSELPSPSYGYGFTRTLKPFGKYLDEHQSFKEVILERHGKVEFDTNNRKLLLNITALQQLHDTFTNVFAKNKTEMDLALHQTLHPAWITRLTSQA